MLANIRRYLRPAPAAETPGGPSQPACAAGREASSRTSHENRIREHFDDRVIFTGTGPIFERPLLVLAFTNRSGSNLLADYLRQTKGTSGLGEYLNAETAVNIAGKEGLDSFPKYIQHLAENVARQGQFGVKASLEQLGFLRKWRILDMFDSVSVVHIHRDDILSQAVSHWIARETGQWTSLQQAETETVHFDADRILGIVGDISRSDAAIREMCALNGLCYVSASYEDLCFDPKVAVDRIAGWTGIDSSAWQPQQPRISRQANALNTAFLSRLNQHLRYATGGSS